MGDKIGRIHLGKQDLSELQTRKMKGLKRARDVDKENGEMDDLIGEEEDEDEDDNTSNGIEAKRRRLE